jgi:hypothetical protein
MHREEFPEKRAINYGILHGDISTDELLGGKAHVRIV